MDDQERDRAEQSMKNAIGAAAFGAVGTALSEFWEGREAREKRLLTIGGAIVALVIVYSVGWAPAYEGRQKLRETLPQQRAQLAQMQAEAREAREFSGAAAGAAPSGDELRQAMSDSLTAHGLPNAQVSAIGDSMQVRAKNISFGDWIGWVDDMRKQNKVQVSEANVTALEKDGQVDLDATLAPAVAPTH
jgi:general secretion pathway protein M